MSSYGQMFQDPRRVLEEQKELKEKMFGSSNFANDQTIRVLEESLDSLEDQAETEEADALELGTFGEINVELDNDMVNHEEKPYFDAELVQQLALDQLSNSVLSYHSHDDE